MSQPARHPVSRRSLLTGSALTVGGALAGAAATAAATGGSTGEPSTTSTVDLGAQAVPFHGPHQAGIETPAQAHAVFLALDLTAGVDRPALVRLMRLLTDDAARLTQGTAPLADGQPELAHVPARLTVTFGFGPRLFDAAGLAAQRPASLQPLPPFGIDKLQDRWSGGDLLIQICADDPVTVAHAQRMLVKDSRAFATVRWLQRGFRRGRGMQDDGATQRNVLGQLDGTGNPAPGSAVFAGAVWTDDGPAWLHGGTTLVVRRIRAELEAWDAADTVGKEFAVGRRLTDGAPLTGQRETDPPDFAARNALGFPVISEFSHVARAHVAGDRQRIFRRPYNYDEPPGPDGTADSGLIFAAYQRDIAAQFLPIQRNLAEADLLNEWITSIGSAVFAVPPGCEPGGWIGQGLLG
ncbi:Dyp-type peroxidase [Dactylosporangium sp. AC04546]|uniref:Dyp-type peroxidase n=1 Tax=Dactylosporangium sp. AC04546 TaxID=2862460 RepID=UPI001EE01DF7|nr:Dyp-type peroxidase [Dactylosporangium sp. AC04546]WVK79352.1 Dyp-type peroxidase [Dactylosporangium sp. AC04546]